MKNVITFVIPLRHPKNARNWQHVKRHLSQTVLSISRQQGDGWKAVIVANRDADLPEIPRGFEVKRVDFPPNLLYKQGSAGEKEFYDAVRNDKGRRVLAGMLHAGEMGHVMVVDDDDFVSRHLTSFVSAYPQANGWYIRDGYFWSDGGRLLYRSPEFFRICGTSHIVRSDLYQLPANLEVADETYIRQMLGSHIFLHDYLNASGTPLAPLPFVGAVYRIGHAESHSRFGVGSDPDQKTSLVSGKSITERLGLNGLLTSIRSNPILREYFFRGSLLRTPAKIGRRILRLRLKNRRIEKEFFGLTTS